MFMQGKSIAGFENEVFSLCVWVVVNQGPLTQ